MNDPVPQVNWSIRRSRKEAFAWDDLMHALRREVDDRAINKTDIVRALMELAGTPSVRAALVRSLRQNRRAS